VKCEFKRMRIERRSGGARIDREGRNSFTRSASLVGAHHKLCRSNTAPERFRRISKQLLRYFAPAADQKRRGSSKLSHFQRRSYTRHRASPKRLIRAFSTTAVGRHSCIPTHGLFPPPMRSNGGRHVTLSASLHDCISHAPGWWEEERGFETR
jgi:hypothetical protein